MILCTDKNGGTGKNNTLPWGNNYPEDLQYFKGQTINSTVVMGRKTFESLPFEGGLPNRYNYVITSGDEVDEENYQMTDLETVVGNFFSKSCVGEDFWIIGGKSIYEQLFPYVEEIHHSIIVDKEYTCDTFMDTKMWENNPNWKLHKNLSLSDNIIVNIWRNK
jgi:dihydrofolate reductase